MEMVETRNPKRAREEGEEKQELSASSTSSLSSSSSSSPLTSVFLHKSKKQEFLKDLNKDNIDVDYSYNYRDGIGVFDFPWLKEDTSVVFQVKDYLEAEDTFGLWLDDGPDQDPGLDRSMWELGYDGLWSSVKIEDLESVECVWRCVCMDGNDGRDHDPQSVEINNRTELEIKK